MVRTVSRRLLVPQAPHGARTVTRSRTTVSSKPRAQRRVHSSHRRVVNAQVPPRTLKIIFNTLATLLVQDLSTLDLVGLMIDGAHGAATTLREGMAGNPTVLRLNLPTMLARTLRSTNAV